MTVEIYTLTSDHIAEYCRHLLQSERSLGTVEKYRRDLTALSTFLNGQPLTAEKLHAWKTHLSNKSYAPRTINSMLAAVNGLCRYLNHPLQVKYLKIQRQLFRDDHRELTKNDYNILLQTAKKQGLVRLALLMETLCATGLRVSELRYITVEAVQFGKATVTLKGKIRTILLPEKLCRKLSHYAAKQKNTSGEIFLTKKGHGISRRQIWFELKRLSYSAGIDPSKVFPHNFRHLFATVFYKSNRDIARLADILGHSSIETTRIYLMLSEREQLLQLDRLGLIS